VVIDFNFRFCTESTAEACKQRVHAVLDRHGLEYDLAGRWAASPF
jgi:succinyl-diaminopimelate desuccinylase